MILAPLESGHGAEVVGFPVDSYPDEAALPHVLEQLAEFALPSPHHWGEHLDAGLLRPAEHGVGDLGGALAGDRRAVVGTVRDADPRPEQAQVVVDLGDGADGGPRILSGGLLLDRDGG